jgi:hypothetical protein
VRACLDHHQAGQYQYQAGHQSAASADRYRYQADQAYQAVLAMF